MKSELGEVFGVLLLFFCMTVVSLVMVFSKFESATVDFWSEQEELSHVVNKLTKNDVFDVDNTKTVGGVDEIKENSTLSK